jgi:LytS/YehU family sensor histidine kinase
LQIFLNFAKPLAIWQLIYFFFQYSNKKLEMERENDQLERTILETESKVLRAQMNPHFVFNAMSVIQSYIFTHNPEKSSMFLVNFSKLMRLILENSPKEFIPLELEKEILQKYLNIQKLRFEDRFEFELDFDEDLYNKTLDVNFHARLRDEQRFDGVEELVEQLKKDEKAVRAFFATCVL